MHHSPRSAPRVEAVEVRRLLSVSLASSTGILRVYGGERTDQIAFALQKGDPSRLRVSLNGVVSKFDFAAVNKVIIDGYGGDDVIDLGGLRFRKATIEAGPGDDFVRGGPGRDAVTGSDGDDTLRGFAGDDILQGGVGNDSIVADAGNDTVQGWGGDDTLSCGDGNDIADGNDGNDEVWGGYGNDYLSGSEGDDLVCGERGDDSPGGGNGTDRIYGGRGADEFGSMGTQDERKDFDEKRDRIQVPSWSSGGAWTGSGIVTSTGSSAGGYMSIAIPPAMPVAVFDPTLLTGGFLGGASIVAPPP